MTDRTEIIARAFYPVEMSRDGLDLFQQSDEPGAFEEQVSRCLERTLRAVEELEREGLVIVPKQGLGDPANAVGLSQDVEPASAVSPVPALIPIAEPWRGWTLSDVLPTLARIAANDFHDWTWCRNSGCKYLTIRIDTRDGGYVRIADRDGSVISLHDLAHQYRAGAAQTMEARSDETSEEPAR
jgi:hypothetical protein